ncbi:MAG: hypothetical protein K2G24_01670 [Muribaculaceae bacterium]|nr:hypothetical protein [Muribaculaceae bacterium]
MKRLIATIMVLGPTLVSAGADVRIPAGAENLSVDGTANCYIMKPGSTGYFDARFKGNSTVETVGEIAGVKLVWQDSGELVSALDYDSDKGAIVATVAARSGNAVVAAVAAGGEILWSWHLWIVDYDPDNDYTTEPNASGSTWTFMDRNLGATTTERGVFGNYGMIYQWGRKDPFPGAADFTIMNDDYSYENDGEPQLYAFDGSELPSIVSQAQYHGTIALSIANPAVFYAMTYNHTGVLDEYGEEIVKNDYPTGDWCDVSDDDYWGGESMKKTIYDPSPVGYKVPVCDADGNTPYAWLTYADMVWDSEHRGAEQNGQWFPATGTRVYASGGIDHPDKNHYSGLWIGTKGKASADLETYPDLYGQYMMIVNGKRTFKVSKDKRSQGMSLRCVRDESFVPGGVGNVAPGKNSVPAAVYSITGVKMLESVSDEAMRTLPPGIYVSQGHKIIVK